MMLDPRRVLAGLAVGAALAGLTATVAAAEPSPVAPPAPYTVSVLGLYRVVALTEDGRMVRSVGEYAPSWLPLRLPADQAVEVTDGSCQEIAGPSRPVAHVETTSRSVEMAYCAGAQR